MLRKNLNKILYLPVNSYRKYKANREVSKLISHKHPSIKAIGIALHETLNNKFSNKEQKWIDKIEKRRSNLLEQDTKINVIDYGAGSGNTPRTKEEMEKGVNMERSVSELCKVSKSRFWASILFKLIRKLKPHNCLELGTCVGISAAYQSAALEINGIGKLVTLEGSPETAIIANETLESLGIDCASIVIGPFNNTLDDVLRSLKPIDFFFNDGHHDQDAVITYFNQALPYISDVSVIVFDDISWSEGMKRAWCEIVDDERVAAVIELNGTGIVLLGSNPAIKTKFSVPFDS